MKPYSRSAVASCGLAFLGIFLLPGGLDFSLVAGLALELTAVGLGISALRSIRKAQGRLRGKSLAIGGLCLGGSLTVLSQLALVLVLLSQWNRAQGPGQVHVPASSLPASPAADFTSNLPLVVLETRGQSISKHREIVAHARFFAPENGRASLEGKPEYDGLVTVHLRGFTSLRLPKRSYTFHTVDSRTNQVKVPLLGLPKEEDWVLYAPLEDKTLMRDVLVYELANRMGRYAPRTRFVELFVKSSPGPLTLGDYAGIYVLIERIKRGKDRVNIQKLEPAHNAEPELTGGYIIKRDHSEDQGARFQTQRGGPYFYVYPKAADITSAQRAWLAAYLNAFESALHGERFADPQAGYAAYLDVDSFIDMHWLVELSKNVDGFRYSAYLTKDRGGKLRVEPPWDWNRSFGNANYYDGWDPQGWYWPHLRQREISWYRRLKQDPAFAQRCKARWLELRKDVFDPKKLLARVDEIAAQLDEAQRRNFQRWPVLGRHLTCNHYVGHSFAEEVRWMKTWLERRIAWIDSQVGLRPPLVKNQFSEEP